jgi:hypothetical protein
LFSWKCGVSTVNSDKIAMKNLFNFNLRSSNFSLFIIMILVFFAIGGCKKSETDSTQNNNTTTIPKSEIVGYEYNGDMRMAKYWKDGVASYLSDGVKDVQIFSVSVSGTDVFMAGVEKNESGSMYDDASKMPKYWKNGTAIGMSVFDFGAGASNGTNGVATSVYAIGGNAYVAGYMCDGSCNDAVAVLWTNGGTPALLSNQFNGDSYANSVFVTEGGIVYAAGNKSFTGGNGEQAIVWTNGTEVPLTDGTGVSEANSIFVSGTDVYVCGGFFNSDIPGYWRAVYWKNGSIHYLSDGSSFAMANSIFVSGNDVYVSGDLSVNGSSSSANATVWKNGVATNLSLKNSGSAKSVFVKGSDVFVGGYKYLSGYRAALWKNGTEYLLSDATKKDFVNGIFIP